MHHRLARRLLVTILPAVLAAGVAIPASSRPVQARDGQTFVDLANDYRADAGVPPVRAHDVINRIAARRADQMAERRELFHDLDYVEDRLAANGVCWRHLGEIIAYNARSESERIPRFLYQWYTSDFHRGILLGADFTHAGGSWTTGGDGYHYAVMIFVELCGEAPAQAPATPFTDIGGSPWASSITWVYKHGVMGGCSATKFCPTADMTRGALAQALADGLNLPATNRDFYDDDGASRFEDGINRLAAAGLAVPCGRSSYCPARQVTRGALATAVAVALRLPSTGRDYFDDDDGTAHEANINRLVAAGIAGGCGERSYCPTRGVRRGHATVFLRRAFD